MMLEVRDNGRYKIATVYSLLTWDVILEVKE